MDSEAIRFEVGGHTFRLQNQIPKITNIDAFLYLNCTSKEKYLATPLKWDIYLFIRLAKP